MGSAGERNAVAECETFPGRPEDLRFEATDADGGPVGVWLFREDAEPMSGGTDGMDGVMTACCWCLRPATSVLAWGDFDVCAGHQIVAAANRASHGELAITPEEYGEQIERAMRWFRENPAPSGEETDGHVR
jgi:hypothetical protein